MNTRHHPILFATAILLASLGSALAATRYVDQNNTNARLPYTTWSTAATNIQDAVAVAVAGDDVVATNGTYAGGVSINKPLTVRSVSGPQFTTISGGGPCVSLASNARLSGFTVTGGSGGFGGGASGGTPTDCTRTGDSATYGCGAWGESYAHTLNNCIAYFNSAPFGANYANADLNYCCTTPLPPSGMGNITDAPLFVDYVGGDLRLQSNSPCI